jgi:hemerythrin
MPLPDPAALPQVALRFMNEDHAAEAVLLADLADALRALRAGTGPAAPVHARLEALASHTREHFEREEATMRDARFPPYPVHKAEHDRVLAELEREARLFAERGDAERLLGYVTETVPAWFVGHIQSMDQVTARFAAAQGVNR